MDTHCRKAKISEVSGFVKNFTIVTISNTNTRFTLVHLIYNKDNHFLAIPFNTSRYNQTEIKLHDFMVAIIDRGHVVYTEYPTVPTWKEQDKLHKDRLVIVDCNCSVQDYYLVTGFTK